jgi:hypothetical protein
VDRGDSCLKRTNPSPNRPDQVGVAEHQRSAPRYRGTHVDQDHQGLEGGQNHRRKKLLRQLASLNRRIASVEGSLVGDNPVEEGSTVQAGHRSPVWEGRHPAAAKKSRPAEDRGSLVAGGMPPLAVVV